MGTIERLSQINRYNVMKFIILKLVLGMMIYAARAEEPTVSQKDGLVRVRNPEQGFCLEFSTRKVEIRPDERASQDWSCGFALKAFGYGDGLHTVPAGRIKAKGPRVEIQRGDLVEWYVNGPAGVEQGFTLAERPSGRRGDYPLELRMDVLGDLKPQETRQGDTIRLVTGNERGALVYSHLHVFDALGREMPSAMESDGRQIVLKVDDRLAKYPLLVDPLIFSETKVRPLASTERDMFGASVALDGETLVAGAPRDDSQGTSAGAAYIFQRNNGTWSQIQMFSGENGDRFGTSVATDGGVVVVGAPRDGTGSAHVYELSGPTWAQLQELTPPNGGASDEFGASLAMDDGTIVIGAPDAEQSGQAYVFVRNGASWEHQATLAAADLEGSAEFGGSVAIDGDSIVVGAVDQDQTGAAYVFTRTGNAWNEQQKLTVDEADSNDEFGVAVAIEGDTVAVAAQRIRPGGAVYVFGRSAGTWSMQQKLTAIDEGNGDYFGASLAMDDDWMAVGSIRDDDGGMSSGSAYVYQRQSGAWVHQAKLAASDATGSEAFGTAVAVEPGLVCVGAPEDAKGKKAAVGGSVYAYQSTVLNGAVGDVESHSEVDNDGDGFSDEVEVAAGSSASDPTSTPMDLMSGGLTETLQISKLTIKMIFGKKGQADKVLLTGTLPVVDGFLPSAAVMIVDVGGVVRRFALDEKRRFKDETTRFKLRLKKQKGQVISQDAKFTLKILRGNFANEYLDEGLFSNATIADATPSHQIPVSVYFEGVHYRTNYSVAYSAKANVKGLATATTK